MSVVPVDTVVTIPVFASIVATAGVALVHVPPLVVFVSVVFDPKQTAVVPPIADAVCCCVTVTVVVAVDALHPPVAAIVYVITVVPVDTVVTIPVFASIVATAGVALLHVPPGVVLVSVVLDPKQTAVVPPIADAICCCVTVTVVVAVDVLHPPVAAIV
jgi:hypothetical protein